MYLETEPIQERSVIRKVTISGLYGLYNYVIDPNEIELNEGPRLLVLYGDNGSGKTTLLKLVFNLLCPPGWGRKSAIAEVMF